MKTRKKVYRYSNGRGICNLFTVIALCISLSVASHSQSSQDRMSRTWLQLKSALDSRGIDTTYLIGQREAIDVDSSIGVKNIARGRIQDPYGTLRHCFVFAISIGIQISDTNSTVVVMRDGQIIWMSPLFSGDQGGKITAILDLNKDGKVDIVTEWMFGPRGEQRSMWIHSWDGRQGRVINDTSCEKYGSEKMCSSNINALDFHIVDKNGDGIMEIRGEIGEYDPRIEDGQPGGYHVEKVATWKWNGKKYVELKKLHGKKG
jgi:hypothetical protein